MIPFAVTIVTVPTHTKDGRLLMFNPCEGRLHNVVTVRLSDGGSRLSATLSWRKDIESHGAIPPPSPTPPPPLSHTPRAHSDLKKGLPGSAGWDVPSRTNTPLLLAAPPALP